MNTKDLRELANLLGMSYQDIKYISDEITTFIETIQFEFYLRIVTNITLIIACILIVMSIYKIKKYTKLIYLKLYGFEEDDNENENNEKSTCNFSKIEKQIQENIEQEEALNKQIENLGKENIEKIIMYILIGIIILIILLKFIL